MKDTQTLIHHLSSEAGASKPLPSPRYSVLRLVAVLALYGVGVQCVLGMRPDIALQFTRFFFVSEIVLLLALLLTSVAASVLAMYPDAYQKPKFLMLPYGVFFLLACLVIFQLLMPSAMPMIMPGTSTHTMECALCIASVALLPSALIFAIIRRGASVRLSQAGSFAVLAASSIGCLTLRLAEVTDSMPHVLLWHYVPTVLFSTLGALLGKWLLRW